ncbi:MAG: Rpp14/Pop5 family protein [Candidatus Hodarchaeales archaeon]|jgi:RNase P/RNase MRP subunit POP5
MKKERVRYLTIRFICSRELTEKDAWFIIAGEVKRLFGVTGASEAGLYLSHFEPETQTGIFRVSHFKTGYIQSSLCFLNSYHSEKLFIYSENLTGSLKKAKSCLKDTRLQERFQTLKRIMSTTK